MVDIPNWNDIKKAAIDVQISAVKALAGQDAVMVNDLSELVKPGCRDGLLSIPTADARKTRQGVKQ